MAFDGRQPSMEDNLRWKMTFKGRKLSKEDISGVAWEQLVGKRRSSMEDDLRCKTTFDVRRSSMEENLSWRMTFDGRQSLMEDDL